MDTGQQDRPINPGEYPGAQELHPRFYRPPQAAAWQGRIDGDEPEHRRWHQHVELLDLTRPDQTLPKESEKRPLVLLGFACDEGVRRNQGRIGAQQGPEALRKAMANLPVHQTKIRIVDAGDIYCPDGELEAAQEQLGLAVRNILEANGFPLLIGGGHEITYGHYLGLKTRQESPGKGAHPVDETETSGKRRLGIINFDAHFDNREPGKAGPSSGTGFWQIARDQQQLGEEFHYLALGIQNAGNTGALFQRAEESGTKIVLAADFHPGQDDQITRIMQEFLTEIDEIYLTIDLDVFAAAYAPGVSAPTALGIQPDHYFFKILDIILQSGKLRSADFAELNPSLDKDQQTAKLAAAIIAYMSQRLTH